MTEPRIRPKDYHRLLNTIIEEGVKADLEVRFVGTVVYGNEGFVFPMLKSTSRKAKYTAVLVAGQHGDEFWAVDCLLQALRNLDKELWNLYIFPVSNPWGWTHTSRLNGEKKGSNWRVGERETKELKLIFDNTPHKVDLFIDCHGDDDRAEVYTYERRIPGASSLAKLALKDSSDYFDVYKARTVYKEPNRGGVVTSGREGTLEEYFFEQRGATYSITLELPGKILGTGINRLAGGARLILTTLSNFERARGEGTKAQEGKQEDHKIIADSGGAITLPTQQAVKESKGEENER